MKYCDYIVYTVYILNNYTKLASNNHFKVIAHTIIHLRLFSC